MITSLTIRVDTEYSIIFKDSIKIALFLALWYSCPVTVNDLLWLQMTSTKGSAESKDYHPLILLWESHEKQSIGWQREHGMRHIRSRNVEEEPVDRTAMKEEVWRAACERKHRTWERACPTKPEPDL